MTVVGQEDISVDDNIHIFPNPSEDVLNITGLNTSQSNKDIIIRSAKGAVVRSVTNYNSSTLAIDLSTTIPGFYLVEIRNENEISAIKKLIVY